MSNVHVTLTENVLRGYFWACPKNRKFTGDFISFSNEFSHGEIEHIYAPDFIDYLPMDNRDKMIISWSQLISIGGKLTIGGTDPFILSRKLFNRTLTIQQFNTILFKTSARVHGFTSINEMRKVLTSNNFEIDNIYLDEITCKYTIDAIRKNVYV